jgi:4-alpha-glucanotransferase
LQGPQYWGWPSWPEDYRDPGSLLVNRFARERVQDVEYFLYLQWLAAEQLCEAQATARELGMIIGLYGDVAVGANSAGSETWSNRHLYRQGASVGAPPDALALKGQDWGIPPQDPNELRAQQYQPFIGLIRNNMRYFAALRLDHVMSLYRLWWVPRGLLSKDGTYVHYPLDDLIAIMALESERDECLVIGEDLGTVPEAMTIAMEHYRAYHYKVLLFEQEPSGRFKPPDAYVPTALAVVTTHDLPTLRGWWEEGDLTLRDRLDLYPSAELKLQAHAARASERRELLLALVAENLWRWSPDQPLPPYSPALSRAVHAYLALSRANIAMIQVEDLIGMGDPVNVPGTDTEHPNWQRKVTQDLADIFARADVRDILEAMNSARRGEHPNA